MRIIEISMRGGVGSLEFLGYRRHDLPLCEGFSSFMRIGNIHARRQAPCVLCWWMHSRFQIPD